MSVLWTPLQVKCNRMISEGSCDTEDWINDAENTALITGTHYILQYIQNISQSY